MTIIEVLKTGKRFKRTYWDDYILDWELPYRLSVQDILAEDWEIEPGPIVWETEIVEDYNMSSIEYMAPILKNTSYKLQDFIGKKVKVTVEPLE
jgi:hypothetical protein